MTAAAACAAVILVLTGCTACGASLLAGHERPGCLRRALAIRALIIAALAAIAAVRIARAARHPLRHAGYLAARMFRRIPARDPDGEPLGRDEMRAFIGIVECWRYTAATERSRT